MNFRTPKTYLFATCLSFALLCGEDSLYADIAYVLCHNNFIYVIDTETNLVTTTIAVSSPTGIAITPDGSFVYVSSSANSNVTVIDTSSNTVVGSPITIGSSAGPNQIAFTADGAFAYVENGNQTISVIQTSNNTVTDTINVASLNGNLTCITVSSTGMAYTATQVSSGTSHIGVIDTSTNALTNTVALPNGAWLNDAAASSNGAFVYFPDKNLNVMDVFNTSSNTITTTVSVGQTPIALAITPNGRFAYVINQADSTASVIQLSNNTVVATVPGFGTSPNDIAITSDGKHAYVTNGSSSTISIINTTTNTVEGTTITVGTTPAGIAMKAVIEPVLIYPPSNLTGSQEKNGFGLEYELYNALQWQATPTLDVAGYYVYNGDEKIATLAAWKLNYQDHNVKKGVSTTYSITAFDSANNESTAETITISGAVSFTQPSGLTDPPAPPTGLTGEQKKNDFGIVYEIYNTLSWQEATDTISYTLSRNGEVIASLLGDVTSYQDHNQTPQAQTYELIAINDQGSSAPAVITVGK